MSNALLNYNACSETFFDVDKLIHKTCHLFIAKHKCSCVEYDDVLSESYILYLRAYQNFDVKRNIMFSTFLISYIRWGLLSFLNRIIRQQKGSMMKRYSKWLAMISCYENGEILFQTPGKSCGSGKRTTTMRRVSLTISKR